MCVYELVFHMIHNLLPSSWASDIIKSLSIIIMMVVGPLVSERAALALLSLDSSKDDNSCCLTSDKMSSRSDPVSVR